MGVRRAVEAKSTMSVADYSKRRLKTEVPHFKSTDLNRIQVTIRSLASTCKLNSAAALCWLLPPVIVP